MSDTRITKLSAQANQAAEALLNHLALKNEQKNKMELIDEDGADESILLSVGLAKIPRDSFKSFKGKQIPLPHPMVTFDKDSNVCLLVKDLKEAETWMEKEKVQGVTKVLSLQQLRTQYHTYAERRELHSSFDAFVADDRIVCMLPKTLGRVFYNGAKRPIPFRLAMRQKATTGIQQRIKSAVESTYFYVSGSCSTIRIANGAMTPDQIQENVVAVVKCLANGRTHADGSKTPSFVQKGWKGIQSLHLKSTGSVALPVFSQLPSAAQAAPESSVETITPKKKAKSSDKKKAKAATKKRKLVDDDDKAAKKTTKKTAKKSKKEETTTTQRVSTKKHKSAKRVAYTK